jgi:DNA invertase Pin-like site-specific DNA recombinase
MQGFVSSAGKTGIAFVYLDVGISFLEESARSLHISDIYVILKPAMKRAALYMRVSTLDQHPETQLYDLRQMAAQRGFEIVQEYTDRISGAKARRPGLDEMMRDARRGCFDVVLVWASDRIARSVKHFLEVLDELNRLKIEYVSFRENIDTGGPLGRAIVIIVGAVAELERNLIIERVRAGMRRARLEGQHIGRPPLVLDHGAILPDRQCGQSLGQIARTHSISRATVHRVIHSEIPAQSAVS